MKTWAVLACLLLFGCAHDPPSDRKVSSGARDTLTLADGTEGKIVRCNGNDRTMTDCFVKAGDECPGGYQTVDQQEQRNQFSLGDLSTVNIVRNMIIKCNNASNSLSK